MLNAKELARRYGPHALPYVEQLISLALSRGDDVGALELLSILEAVEEGLKDEQTAKSER